MEVMNRAELTQTDILVGQKSITRSFGVSDDPMLMSMLSTGFYANPHRTMIQEILFNAWDAHRMGNCQDRPIDIYVNETSGLIVRDYGPGIDPGVDDDNMHEIYCMYGGSTKRKLKNQTGGFGLGSKSPFAYTESFTVTSHFGGTKNMYLISRVSESNGGKPGMTSLVRVPTTETGLMVTVPLKAGHAPRTYDHIKDVLFLSGIKAMIHYLEESDEYVDSLTLPAGQYYVDEERTGKGQVYAVYGGVRYKIVESEEFAQEYKFIQLLGGDSSVFVGFAPDTLSPLPNREGLNMGEKSRETIKATFELCTEKFQVTFDPALKSLAKLMFAYFKQQKLQGHIAYVKCSYFGFRDDLKDYKGSFPEELYKQIPPGTHEDIWKIACNMVVNQTTTIVGIVGRKRWRTIFIAAFIEAYPEYSDLGFAALKADIHIAFPIVHSGDGAEFVRDFYAHKTLRDDRAFVDAMKKAYPDDDALHPILRINRGKKWEIPIRERTKSHLSKTKWGVGKVKAKDIVRQNSYQSLDMLYDKDEGNDLSFIMMHKTVLIAQTITMLDCSDITEYVARHDKNLSCSYSYYGNLKYCIPGYVVHGRKGAYAKAVQILKNQGYHVIEGMEPEKKEYVPKIKEVVRYSKIMPKRNDDWQSREISEQFEDPTHMYYATLATIRGYNSSERPAHDIVYWFLEKNPKTVVVTNIKTAENLHKNGVLHFYEGVMAWYDKASADVNRMTNIIRASKISMETALNPEILSHPMMQLELGMEPVDPQDKDFWYESRGYSLIQETDYYPLRDHKKRVKEQLEILWRADPEKKNIIRMCSAVKIFNKYELSSLWSASNTQKQDELVDKLIIAMKQFA